MKNSWSSVRVAVVGASSLIGQAVIDEMRRRKLSAAHLHALEEQRHIGARAGDEEAPLPVEDVDAFDFASVDLVFFCGRASVSQRHAAAAAATAWVIDGSGAFRNATDVPLVAAEVNPQVLQALGGAGLIALPGSASVALATVLSPLAPLSGGLERIEVATYQAVSGSGRSAIDELAGETVAMLSGRQARGRAFGRQIAFNVIPQVDAFEPDGATREEKRLCEETRRLLLAPALAINATAARVPVFFGHSLAVHAAFVRAVQVAEARQALKSAGISVIDALPDGELPTPATLAQSPDQIYVGRIRADTTRDRGLNFWVVADNIRKCAAHNAVSVAQILVNSSR